MPVTEASTRLTGNLTLEGIRPSIGTVPAGFDKALMETVMELFKIECTALQCSTTGPIATSSILSGISAGWAVL